jgi:hypothetical protein
LPVIGQPVLLCGTGQKGQAHTSAPFPAGGGCLNPWKRGDFMGVEELIPLIANIGFPVVVSLYLLTRIEKKLDQLSASIKELSSTVAKMV